MQKIHVTDGTSCLRIVRIYVLAGLLFSLEHREFRKFTFGLKKLQEKYQQVVNVNQNMFSLFPQDVWDKFDGKSREDLIEMIVGLQETVEDQARKQSDLEDYIDSLLMKVLSTAPQLLNKASPEGRNSPK